MNDLIPRCKICGELLDKTSVEFNDHSLCVKQVVTGDTRPNLIAQEIREFMDKHPDGTEKGTQ